MMNRSMRALVAAFLISMTSMPGAFSHEMKIGDLLLTDLWSRATPTGAKVGAAYLTIENKGNAPDRLIETTSPVAHADVHEMATVDGVMRMRPLGEGVVIPPGQKVTFGPGGYHIMMTELKGPLKEGELLHVKLRFEKAGEVDATFHVRSVGAQGPATGGGQAGQGDGMAAHGHSGGTK